MTQDIYWSDYDAEETLSRLAAQNEKAMVQVEVTQAGRTRYAVTVTCNDNGREGQLRGTLDVVDEAGVRLSVVAYRQRNRQLAMVLVPVVLGVGAWVASATGSMLTLVLVPVVLVAGTSAIQRLVRPQAMALDLLLEAIRAPKAAPRRRRMKKRQWGKERGEPSR
jgi:hypothetical protein